MILVADSGSTKTAWGLVEGNERKLFTTQGINPFHQSVNEISAVLNQDVFMELPDGRLDAVYFYGAGCTDAKVPEVARAIRLSCAFEDTKVFVGSDLLGAARALCGFQAGIVCILGTGSNSCYYDGERIVENVSPLGYILGDEGSGAYIGKKLVGDILKKQLPKRVCDLFHEEMKLTAADIIEKVYRQPMPNRFLAHVSQFCARHRDIREVFDFSVSCFRDFFIRNVQLYARHDLKVNFVGSIAWFYQRELRTAAEELNFDVGKIIQSPLDAIIDYHQVCRGTV